MDWNYSTLLSIFGMVILKLTHFSNQITKSNVVLVCQLITYDI